MPPPLDNKRRTARQSPWRIATDKCEKSRLTYSAHHPVHRDRRRLQLTEQIQFKPPVLVYRCLSRMSTPEGDCFTVTPSTRRPTTSDSSSFVAISLAWNALPPDVTASQLLHAFKRRSFSLSFFYFSRSKSVFIFKCWRKNVNCKIEHSNRTDTSFHRTYF